MKWVLAVATTLIVFTIGLLCLWVISPESLGVQGQRADIRLVKIDKKVPPFFDHVLDTPPSDPYYYAIQDPYVQIRGLPLLKFPAFDENGKRQSPVHRGPHDVLGFRNLCVPNQMDVIAFGDSMTYGGGVRLEQSWPAVTEATLQSTPGFADTHVYNVSLGGWSSTHYLYLFKKMLSFSPKVIVVAIYTGNDPLEATRLAYSVDDFAYLRPERFPEMPKLPKANHKIWTATLSSGQKYSFTPWLRMISNEDTPAANAGYEIISLCVKKMYDLANANNVRFLVTIVPTKEAVFAPRLSKDGVNLPDIMNKLLAAENARVAKLKEEIAFLENAVFIDIKSDLQKEAMQPQIHSKFYHNNQDGHPWNYGYEVIAGKIEPVIRSALIPPVAATPR